MKPIICDVFSTRDLTLDANFTVDGNLYVDGNADFVFCEDPVIINGDLIVNGELSATELIVHGDLVCETLSCDNVKVDGNIYVSNSADVVSITSTEGNIFINEDTTACYITASEGSIHLGRLSDVDEILAFDSIFIDGDLTNVTTIVSGTGLTSNGIIDFSIPELSSKEMIKINILSGGISSQNINI